MARLFAIVVLSAAGLVCTGFRLAAAASQIDVSAQVAVTRSGFVYNRTSQTYDTTVTLENISQSAVTGPISLVVSSITPSSVSLANALGTMPDGKPYVDVPLGDGSLGDGSLGDGSLAPAEKVSGLVLKFKNPQRVSFNITTQVLAGAPATNTPPVANAGPDQSVAVGATVTLDGSGSSDADGNPLSFRWSLVSAPNTSLASLSDAAAAKPSFVADKPGEYTVRLIVNDGQADSTADTVIVSTRNRAPVASAGGDQSVAVGATVTLDGSGSSDADGDALTFRWSLIQTPQGSGASLSNASASNPSFQPDRPGNYVAELTVNDGQADSAPSAVTITASNAPPPLSVTIASPLPGAAIHDDHVSVYGSVTGAENFGVTISGAHHPAVVMGNTFIVYDVPLQLGSNTLTVDVMSSTAEQTTATVGVTSTGAAQFGVSADPETGLAPLNVGFNITWQTQDPPQAITADFDGDGTADSSNNDLTIKFPFTYQTPGLYKAAFAIIDAQGATHQITVPILIQDANELDQKFRAIWGDFTGNLMAQDIDSALQLINAGFRDKYSYALTALQSSLPAIEASFSFPETLEITGDYAEYGVTRLIDGEQHLFFIYFRQGGDGVWRIDAM
ncbi:MAG: PKD domain-containing protein [Gammaproteobacteria bacterium]